MKNATKSILARLTLGILLAANVSSPSLAAGFFSRDCGESQETNLPVYKWVCDQNQDQIRDSKRDENQPRNAHGIAVLVHGITQSALSLSPLADKLASADFLVYGIDQRGHGWWHFNNHKGTPGYRCNFSQSVRDVDQLLPLLKEEYPQLPIFIIGESAGAAVAIRAAAQSPNMVSGVVLAGAGYRTGKVNPTWVLSDLSKSVYRLHHQINITRYQRKYGTEDLASLEDSFKDPMQRSTMSAREILG